MKINREFVFDVLVTSQESNLAEYSIGEANSLRQAESIVLKHFKADHYGDLVVVRPYYKQFDIYGSHEYVYRCDGKSVQVRERSV